jgi:hypothetical protein
MAMGQINHDQAAEQDGLAPPGQTPLGFPK